LFNSGSSDLFNKTRRHHDNAVRELNARKLLDDTRLPLDWNEQRRSLGFA
jgi:hypothetical protein